MQAAYKGCGSSALPPAASSVRRVPIERLRRLDFALTALFVVLAIDAYRQRPTG